MADLVVPSGADSTALIEAATGLLAETVPGEDREWSDWAKRRELRLKDLRVSGQTTTAPSAQKDAGLTPLLRMVREAEEEEDQWLQSLREALGSGAHPSGDSESATTDSPSTASSILDVLASAPTQKLVSRRASSHVSEASAAAPLAKTLVVGAGAGAGQHHLQKKRSSVHAASSSSIVPGEGKTSPATGAGSGKEVKSFFENFLSPGAGTGTGGAAGGSSGGGSQKK
jgi:hypothetical protein